MRVMTCSTLQPFIPQLNRSCKSCGINQLTIGYVINSLERIGTDQLPISPTRESDLITRAMKQFEEAMETHPDNQLLKDI